MSGGPSEEQINEYREAFALFDQDGDGKVDIKELGTVLRALGQSPTEAELQDMVNEVDIEGNGSLSFSDFVELMTKRIRQINAEYDIQEAFKVFDLSGDGFISMEELRLIMMNLGENLSDDDISEMMNEADINGDGQIDFQEFVKMMSR